MGKLEGKRLLGRARRRLEDNINMDLEDVECGGMDWNELAQDIYTRRLTCECDNELLGSIKCEEFLE